MCTHLVLICPDQVEKATLIPQAFFEHPDAYLSSMGPIPQDLNFPLSTTGSLILVHDVPGGVIWYTQGLLEQEQKQPLDQPQPPLVVARESSDRANKESSRGTGSQGM